MKTALLLIGALATTPAMAGENVQANGDARSEAAALDLSLPKSATDYAKAPPGTWYGDTSGVPATAGDDAQATPRDERCQGELHGSIAAGMGYSRRGGNSNWQALNLNSCKTYYNDDGDAREVGISISVGQYDGPDGRYGGRAIAPPPMMRGPRR